MENKFSVSVSVVDLTKFHHHLRIELWNSQQMSYCRMGCVERWSMINKMSIILDKRRHDSGEVSGDYLG
jgi:hypothetical protein